MQATAPHADNDIDWSSINIETVPQNPTALMTEHSDNAYSDLDSDLDYIYCSDEEGDINALRDLDVFGVGERDVQYQSTQGYTELKKYDHFIRVTPRPLHPDSVWPVTCTQDDFQIHSVIKATGTVMTVVMNKTQVVVTDDLDEVRTLVDELLVEYPHEEAEKDRETSLWLYARLPNRPEEVDDEDEICNVLDAMWDQVLFVMGRLESRGIRLSKGIEFVS